LNADYSAILDACVLVGGGLRDTLLRLAETPRLYVPKWSEEIISETSRTLQNKFNKSPEQVEYLVSELRKTFPEAWVCGYEPFIEPLRTHEKDRHVLAAAIRCSAQTIVTFNLKHFPKEALDPFDVEAIHPDEFLVNQFHLDDTLVVAKFTEQATAINRSVADQLHAFHHTRALPLFTQTIADALGIKL
jgi:hypothetical protein